MRLATLGIPAQLPGMAVAASAFLVLSLWLAVVLGPQMRMWPWGPALLALAAALTCAMAAAVRSKRPVTGPGTLVLGLLVAGWFAWRAWTSPVAELAQADMLLMAAAVGCFLCVRSIAHDRWAEAVFLWGLAGLLLASLVMIGFQLQDVDFSQFRSRPTLAATGFYGQYNEGANFLIGASFLLMGGAWFGRQGKTVRILWLLIAVAGLAAVWLTRSRGAVFGVVVGCVALAMFVLAIGSKRKAAWFAPAAIAFPILLLASGFVLYFGWEKVQRLRSDGKMGITEMMDNTSRLRNYSLAFDAAMLHPVAGGGSRSYSWTSLHMWNPEEHGLASHLPEQTHNELLQAATDYGFIGAGGVLALLGWLSLRGLWRCKFDEEEKPPEHSVSADAMRLGGIAALAGMLVQSSFSFVFHLLPGAMLLGLALGRLAAPSAQSPAIHRFGRFTTAALAAAIAIALILPGVAGTRALAALLPVYYKLGPDPNEDERLARFSRAIEVWPQSDLHVTRAKIHHQHAIDGAEVTDAARLDLALADYLAASQWNPKFPAHFVNAANLMSLNGQSEEAEALYEKAVLLQGNAEPAFLAHFHQAEHYRRKGVQLHLAGQPAASLQAMEAAFEALHQATTKSAWLPRGGRERQISIYLSLALAQEASGDPAGALKTHHAALELRYHEFQYHAGMLQYRRAMKVWHQRQPANAVPLFRDARHRLQASINHRPGGVSAESIQTHIADIDEHLALLRGAGFGNE